MKERRDARQDTIWRGHRARLLVFTTCANTYMKYVCKCGILLAGMPVIWHRGAPPDDARPTSNAEETDSCQDFMLSLGCGIMTMLLTCALHQHVFFVQSFRGMEF